MPPKNDDDEKLNEVVRRIVEGHPEKHGCENCEDEGMAPTGEIPPGWRYIMVSKKLTMDLDEVDQKTLIVCSICFGLVTRVIKELASIDP